MQELISELQRIYSSLFDPIKRTDAIRKLCQIANSNPEDSMVRQLIYDCIVASKIYGYFDSALFQNANFFDDLYISDKDFISVATLWSSISEGFVLTPLQKEVIELFKEKKKICISAPTSFGKTFVLFEILIQFTSIFSNSLIVVPTNALCTEIFHKIYNISKLKKNYTISNYYDPNLSYSDKNNIFILTPEKADVLLESFSWKLDFFMMDEIYKINDHEDERSKIFDNILYRLLKKTNYCYLAWPYIDEFDEKLQESIFFKKYTQELVPKIMAVEKGKIQWIELKKTGNKIERISPFLSSYQCIVYSWTKKNAEKYSMQMASKLTSSTLSPDVAYFIEYLKKVIDPDYSLISTLKKNIAFHHRWMPRFIQNWILHLFNKGEIKTLFCTSTIIEWINTTAKMVIIADRNKWPKKWLTKFDRKNIYWRSGRFWKHFIWGVVDLYSDQEYEKSNNAVVVSDYSDIKSILNKDVWMCKFIEDDDHIPETYAYLKKEEQSLNEIVYWLPDILKKNKFIEDSKQIAFVSHILSGYRYHFKRIGNKKDFENIIKCISSFFGALQGNFYSMDPFADPNINWAWYYYCNWEVKFYREYIKFYKKGKDVDKIIQDMFWLIYDVFNFKYPKYLSCFQNLYNLVANQYNFPWINLNFLIKKLEYGYAELHEILLKNRWVSEILIDKLSRYFQGIDDLNKIELKMKEIQKNQEIKLERFEKDYLEWFLNIQ